MRLDVLLCYWAADQYSETANIFQSFQTVSAYFLKVDETKISIDKPFNQDHFGTKGNHESSNK